jgi:hypothetical protein
VSLILLSLTARLPAYDSSIISSDEGSTSKRVKGKEKATGTSGRTGRSARVELTPPPAWTEADKAKWIAANKSVTRASAALLGGGAITVRPEGQC